MGRPINSRYIGSPTTDKPNTISFSYAYIPGASSVSSSITIIEQTGSGKYLVTDGTNTGIVSLVPFSTVLQPGQAKLIGMVDLPGTISQYIMTSVSNINPGSGYSVGDMLLIPNTDNMITVTAVTSQVTGGMITGGDASNLASGLLQDPAATSVSSTGGTGTGATFTITSTSNTLYTTTNMALNAAGTGYAVNDTILVNLVGTATVKTVGTNGVIETISFVAATPSKINRAGTVVAQTSTSGSGTGATFDVTTSASTTFAVASVSINNAGSGYTSGDNLTVGSSLAAFGITGVSTASNAGGISTFYGNSYNGTTYDVTANNVSFPGGSGTGATFNIASSLKTVANSPNYCVKNIYDNTVSTFNGPRYSWSFNQQDNYFHMNSNSI